MSATNRGAERVASDFYPTPPSAYEPLFPYLPRFVHYHEPACGDGRIVKFLRDNNFSATGSDLFPVNAEIEKCDFLKDRTRREFTITNPPFSLALEFCAHATHQSAETLMLLRLNFLASKKRRAWWKMNEPSAIFVLSSRPRFVNNRSDACDYGWFYWGRRFQGIKHL